MDTVQCHNAVDFLLCRDSGGDTYLFKLGKKVRALLFPNKPLPATGRGVFY